MVEIMDSGREIRFEMYVVRWWSVEESPTIQLCKTVSRVNVKKRILVMHLTFKYKNIT